MVAWLIYFKDGAIRNEPYIKYYMEEGDKLDIQVKLILVEDLEFGVKNNTWYIRHQGQEVINPDFVIVRAIYPLLSKQLELMGIKVFNNSLVSELCNDKAKTYQYLAKLGIPMVDSLFYKNNQVKEALQQINQLSVIKSVDGHGGSQVFAWRPEEINQSEIINGLGNSDVVIQPFVGKCHQDLRVYVIGKEIVAAVLRTARSGFKSNFSLGGEVRIYQLCEVEHSIVQQIINQFDFGLVGIDFIIGDKGELIFNEIEDVVGSRMLYQCSNINIVNRYLIYIRNKIKS